MPEFFLKAAPYLLENLALFVVLAFGFALLSAYLRNLPGLVRQGAHGALFGAMAVFCMSFPLVVQPGVIADLRNVVVLMAAPFGGPVAGVIAGAVAGGYRLYLGGAGAPVGAITIAISALIGIVFAWRHGELNSLRNALLLGIASVVATLPFFVLLPEPAEGPSFIQRMGPIFAVLNPAAAVTLWLIMSIEIKRRRAEAALKRSETRFRDIVETASDWFWEMDAELRFTYLSRRFTEITGLPPESMIGKRRDEIWIGKETPDLRRHLEDLAARRPFRDFRYPILTPDGKQYYLTASGKPLFDDDGAFRGYRGSGGDVTAEVETLQQLERARRRAEQSNRTKSTFLANMSHELRTPLNAVIGFSEIMRDELLGPIGTASYKDYARDINSSGRFLLELINDILDLSKVEAGRYEIYAERQSAAYLVENAAMLVKERARKNGVRLVNEVPPDLPLIYVDERLMRQALINLIGNAVKFTEKGGEVSIRAVVKEDGGLQLTVADNGVGIDPEDLERIMEPFRQARHGRQTRDGTGLGLPLTKAFIELHGGRIDIESAQGAGTTVRLTLPPERVLAEEPPLEEAVPA